MTVYLHSPSGKLLSERVEQAYTAGYLALLSKTESCIFILMDVCAEFVKMGIFCHRLLTKLKSLNTWMTFFLLSLKNILIVLLHIIKGDLFCQTP